MIMKMSSKSMGVLTVSSAVIIATATILTNVLIQNNINNPEKPTNPLNRDKTYHHYSISDKLSLNDKINNLINFVEQDGNIIYFIDEQRFLTNFNTIVRETLKTIPAFTHNYLNYEIKCNYKVNGVKSINVDIVWQLPNNKNKYFDQFVLRLETI